ncbi:MAG: penicillin-binding protein 2 [Nitrospiraceae bacterium]|nr:penicillin-binding protein 2 [Nitrospiraceae bacterium]
MQQDSPVSVLRRLPLLMGFIILFATVLFFRLWYLQVIKGAYYQELAESNRIRPIKIRPPRGVMYDRYGRPMVENVLTFDISIVPEDAPDIDATIAKLSPIVHLAPDAMHKIIDDAEPVRVKYEPVKILEEAPWEEIAMVETRQEDLPGVIVEPEHRRHYPYGGMAAHQFGYIGKVTQTQKKQEQADTGLLVGQSGLEKLHDKLLRGVAGRRMIQVNAAGMKVKDLGIEEPKPGTDLYLTLDLDVQRAAEEGLGDRAGSVVAMDPNSGEILAMVSHPVYDPNLFPRGISSRDWVKLSNDPSHPLYNRAVQSVYPPGSTFKIVTALAGLLSGEIDPNEKITCRGYLTSGKKAFRCWKKGGHGSISFHDALVQSCDVYFYTMGDRMGFDRVAQYARNLGFGSLTGIELYDEKKGNVPTAAWKKERNGEPWYPADNYMNSIGQGFMLVSPIQNCQLVSLVANGGIFYQPQIVKRTRNRETGEQRVFPPIKKRTYAIDPAALELVRNALIGVTTEAGGTAHGAATPLAVVAGKTGTAQVIAQKVAGQRLSESTQDHAWFIGYAPADNPGIAVAVLVEHGGHGGAAAAPVARKVIEEYLKHAGTKTAQ